MSHKPDLRLYAWLTDKHYRGVVRDRPPARIASLYINLNDVFYETAAQTYSFGKYHNYRRLQLLAQTKPEELVIEHQNAVFTFLTNIITALLPSDTLFLTIDGVLIDGKLPTLRRRAYAAGMERESKFFDTNSINVGTPFMSNMENALQRWILANRAGLLPKTVTSFSTIPGEGRHKIFQFIRSSPQTSVGKSRGTHVVYSCDDENISMALITQAADFTRNIVLADNDVYTRNIDISTLLTLVDFITNKEDLSISDARTEDEKRVMQEREKETINSKLLEERKGGAARFHDFVLLQQLWHNSVLPLSPALRGLSFDTMLEWYRQLNRPLIDAEGKIIPEGLAAYCAIMAGAEATLLNNRLIAYSRHPFTTLQQSVDRRGKAVDYAAFRGAWYKKVVSPRGDERSLLTIEAIAGMAFPQQISEEFLFDLFEEYITGIYWTYAYTHNRGVDRWSYPYHYAPLLSDLHWALINFDASKGDGRHIPSSPQLEGRSVYLQSLITIPTRSREQIAEPVQFLSTLKSNVFDLFPYTVQFDMEGISEEDEKATLVPPADIARLEEALSEIQLPPERIGTTLVFELDESQAAARERTITRLSVQETPRGRGRGSERGRGRGRGRGSERGRGRGRGRGGGRGRGSDRGRGRGSAPGLYSMEYPS